MKHEVAIVGGGAVGAALACALGAAGIRVALIEAHAPAEAPGGEGFDLRVRALTRASERILRGVGAWRHLPGERLGPFREMHVWDATGAGEIHFDSADIGEPTLGYIAENRALQHALERRIETLEEVRWYRPAVLEDIDTEPARALLRVDGARLETRLVVGADGTESRVRSLVGIEATRADYHQRAVVACVRTQQSHGETAWQRFLPAGPLAFLPLPPHDLSSIVWSTEPQHATHLLALTASEFARELEDAFASRLGAVTWVGERASFPLHGLRAARYVAGRSALVGDAAHTVHPLAGQGLNLGLLDAAALAEVLIEAHARGRDIGGSPALRRYERWRAGHNLLMKSLLESFKWLFENSWAPVRLTRNAGLVVTDRLHPVKRLIMDHATGRAGDLPALARDRHDPQVLCT
ncbi:MAG: ubiquinone biosynthesis protein UbiH [Gammaproteobacteria bacterium]|nr:ubiquinone biosynthesis protein UbiH [Gammaproteobacteria bacterium]NIR81907.1 ubiquinone biosynthesis protein UbiH [Gammaproteobacteria bacterium]NIR88739.1 ubiquinone biosynthesis protein UbiH [Gammaproteobacteria bacterium]NIU03015.1 ubiquinone biosynthesis protein UbiH [Gammaproteobacteria bacterium]NIV50536.1 ubiquinone biosynthesis protein UbiH [Gammaproteobacteria bacterium]